MWDFLHNGFIQPSISTWGSLILFVKKKNGYLKIYVDYWQSNNLIIKNRYPFPRINDLFHQFQGTSYFSKIYLRLRYHKLRVRSEYTPKTIFWTRYGNYNILVMSFCVNKWPGDFLDLMNRLFQNYLYSYVFFFINDVLIYSMSEDDYIGHLRFFFKS